MKKLLVVGLISSSLVLGGCFKQEAAPEIQKVVQLNIQGGIIQTGSTETLKSTETNSGVTEQVSTGSISGSGVENKSDGASDDIKSNESPLIKIEEKDKKIFYNGSIIITGEYYFDNYFGQVCFNNIDQVSSGLIPREGDDKRVPAFCFSNQEKVKEAFGINDNIIKNMVSQDAESTCTFEGKAQIQISDYITNLAETAVRDKAEIVKIITKEPPEKKCYN